MNDNTTLIHTWNTMVALMSIEPPGKFETMVDGLMMQYVHQPNILIVTPDVQLGGVFAQVFERTHTTKSGHTCGWTIEPPASDTSTSHCLASPYTALHSCFCPRPLEFLVELGKFIPDFQDSIHFQTFPT
jgi:hypothetical protein